MASFCSVGRKCQNIWLAIHNQSVQSHSDFSRTPTQRRENQGISRVSNSMFHLSEESFEKQIP